MGQIVANLQSQLEESGSRPALKSGVPGSALVVLLKSRPETRTILVSNSLELKINKLAMTVGMSWRSRSLGSGEGYEY